MKRSLSFFLLLALFGVVKPLTAFAQTVVYPQVTSVSPTTVKPGDTITLQGKNFGREGQTYCWSREKQLMTYQTVIGAYRQGTSPTSGMPNYRLPIISVSDSTLVAQIPTDMTNGEYLVGYNAEYPKGVCQGYGDILVGFARYDQITVIGGKEAVATRPTVTITSTVAPTVTSIPTPQKQEVVVTEESSARSEVVQVPSANPPFVQSLLNSFVSFFKSLRGLFNL